MQFLVHAEGRISLHPLSLAEVKTWSLPILDQVDGESTFGISD